MMAVAVAALPSCKAISSLIHDGEVVARLGDHKLYRSELDDVIPKGTSPEDSVNLANLYINRLMNIMAPTKSPSSWSGRSSKPVL